MQSPQTERALATRIANAPFGRRRPPQRKPRSVPSHSIWAVLDMRHRFAESGPKFFGRAPEKPLTDKQLVAKLSTVSASLFGVQSHEILREGRGQAAAAHARMAVAYVANTTLCWNFSRIAEAINRDRSVARKACAAVEALRDNPDFDQRLTALEAAAAALSAALPQFQERAGHEYRAAA